jgi:hypothetical protein
MAKAFDDAVANASARGIQGEELVQIGKTAAEAIETILKAGVSLDDLARWGVKSDAGKAKLAAFIKQGLDPKGDMYFYEWFNRSTFGFDELDNLGITTKSELNNFLFDAECWGDETLEHILKGEVKYGDFKGFHYDGYPNSIGKVKSVVAGTKGKGPYTAIVESTNGVSKLENGGMSTFFPDEWTPKQVFDAVTQAYANRQYDPVTKYWIGMANNGMKIQMIVKSSGGYVDNVIVTAFPKL